VTITQSSGKTFANTKHVLYVALYEPFMLFRSDDEGDSWHEVAKEPYSSMRNYAVLADPTNADTVYTAGNTLHRATDGGWTVVSAPLKTYEVRAIAYAPSNANVIYAATDNGVEVSTDNGASWTVKSDGLNTTQWYSVAVSRDGSAVYGAVQDRSLMYLANGSWGEASWDKRAAWLPIRRLTARFTRSRMMAKELVVQPTADKRFPRRTANCQKAWR